MNELCQVAHSSVPTILISRPGIMRQSLQASLATHPGIVVIAVCGDGLTAMAQIAQQRPHLLILDSNLLDEEIEALLGTVKESWPTIRCLALLQVSQREAKLLAAGADATIHRDNWMENFAPVLMHLMQHSENSNT